MSITKASNTRGGRATPVTPERARAMREEFARAKESDGMSVTAFADESKEPYEVVVQVLAGMIHPDAGGPVTPYRPSKYPGYAREDARQPAVPLTAEQRERFEANINLAYWSISHLAAKVVEGLRYHGQSKEEIEQLALLGLMSAATKFDPTRGVKFGFYATVAIKRYLQRELTLATRRRALESTPLPHDTEGRAGVPAPLAPSEAVSAALEGLSDREREVVALRYGLGGREQLTLAEVAGRFGVTKERVRQIQARAIGKLRKILNPEDV